MQYTASGILGRCRERGLGQRVAIGALTEICQIWAPGRFPSVSDGLLDIVGSLLVVSMYQMPGFPRYGLTDMRKPER